MASAAAKRSRQRSTGLQAKISDFGVSKDNREANANAMLEETHGHADIEEINNITILEAIKELKDDSSNRFDGLLIAIDGVRKEVSACTERITQADVRISNTEDEVVTLQAKV